MGIAGAALYWAWVLSLQLKSVARGAAEAQVKVETEQKRLDYILAVLAPILFTRRNPSRFQALPGVSRMEASLVEFMYPGLGIEKASLEELESTLAKIEEKLFAEFQSDSEAKEAKQSKEAQGPR